VAILAMCPCDFIAAHCLMGNYGLIRRSSILFFLFVSFFLFLSAPGLLRADISITPRGSKGLDSDRKRAISSTVLARPVQGQVLRGGEVDLPIDVVLPDSGDVALQISRSPLFGSLQPIRKASTSVLVYRYVNDSKFKSGEDSFEFRIKAPGQAWSTHTASIRIKDPPGVLSVIPGKVNFGKVAIGSTARRSITLCNNFGASVSGTLLLPAPWSLVGDGSYTLAEKETHSFEIEFRPTEAKTEISQLKAAPELPNFPTVPVIGEGIIPFLMDSSSAIVTTEHPKAVFGVTNSSENEMTIGWTDHTDETGLLCSLPIRIPAHGRGEVWVSIGSLNLKDEERRILHPSLRQDNFTLPLEIIALGPKGTVSIKPLQGQAIVTTKQSPVTLHGLIESTSSMERVLELRYQEKDSDPHATTRVLTIAPHSAQPFFFAWSSVKSGDFAPEAVLIESGRVVGKSQWKVAVNNPELTSHPFMSSDKMGGGIAPVVPSSKPSGVSFRLASKDEGCVAAQLLASLKPGVLVNSLLLHWLYFGEGKPGFVIEEKIFRNVLTDRGTVAGESGEESWRRLHTTPVLERGGWVAEFAMPWPGMHVYRVYPEGYPTVIMSQITVPVTWTMFLWPSIKALLCIIFLICLFKVIRRRNWGRR